MRDVRTFRRWHWGRFSGSGAHRLCIAAAAALLAVVGAAACDEPNAPEPGRVRVEVTTVGNDTDEDGYRVRIANLEKQVASNGAVVFTSVPAGTHKLELTGVASYCSVTGGALHTVTVSSSVDAAIAINVSCVATGVQVRTHTSGFQGPPLYRIDVAPVSGGSGGSGYALANGSLLITRLEPGRYTVSVAELREYCRVLGDSPITVDVSLGAVSDVDVDVGCDFVTGIVEVTIRSSGEDLDPNGYRVVVGEQGANVRTSDSARFEVEAGEHIVRLQQIATNCVPTAGSTRSAPVAAGGAAQDTVRVAFDVVCTRAEKIAYQTAQLYVEVVYADGSTVVPLANGGHPAWSPDRKTIAYSSAAACGFWYYYYYGYLCDGHVILMDTETRQARTLTAARRGITPAWSPDGLQLAFVQLSSQALIEGLRIVRADGSAPTTLNLPGVEAPSNPAWSPDGQRLAFGCARTGGFTDICVVNVDGTGFARLSIAEISWAGRPSWSPDGSRIVFDVGFATTPPQVALMSPEGTELTLLGSGSDPDWSGDGSRIVFVRSGGLATMKADGTEVTQLTTGAHHAPAWRR